MTKELKEIMERAVELGQIVSELAKAVEDLQLASEQANDDKDEEELKLGDIHFSSNYGSWKESKLSDKSSKPFYYESSLGTDGHAFGEFTIEEAEELVEFLTEKINYLKS